MYSRVSLLGVIMAILVWVRRPRDSLSPAWCRHFNLYYDEEKPTLA